MIFFFLDMLIFLGWENLGYKKAKLVFRVILPAAYTYYIKYLSSTLVKCLLLEKSVVVNFINAR